MRLNIVNEVYKSQKEKFVDEQFIFEKDHLDWMVDCQNYLRELISSN